MDRARYPITINLIHAHWPRKLKPIARRSKLKMQLSPVATYRLDEIYSESAGKAIDQWWNNIVLISLIVLLAFLMGYLIAGSIINIILNFLHFLVFKAKIN